VASAIEPINLLVPHTTARADNPAYGYIEPNSVIKQIAFTDAPAMRVVNTGNDGAAVVAARRTAGFKNQQQLLIAQ
jgi:hypothetical protein